MAETEERSSAAERRDSSWRSWAWKLALALGGAAALWLGGRELGAYVPRFAQWVDSVGIWGLPAGSSGKTVSPSA